jgi:hypothetical protein
MDEHPRMEEITSGQAYTGLLAAEGLTFRPDASYRIQVRSAPGADSPLFATLRSTERTIAYVDAETLQIALTADQTAMMSETVVLDVVRDDTVPHEYLGGMQTIMVLHPSTAGQQA